MRMLLVIDIPGVEDEKEAMRLLETAVDVKGEAITLYRASHEDIRESGLFEQVNRFGPIRPVRVRPWTA